MPLERSSDERGPFYRWGKSGKKRYYKIGDADSRKTAMVKAKADGAKEPLSSRSKSKGIVEPKPRFVEKIVYPRPLIISPIVWNREKPKETMGTETLSPSGRSNEAKLPHSTEPRPPSSSNAASSSNSSNPVVSEPMNPKTPKST